MSGGANAIAEDDAERRRNFFLYYEGQSIYESQCLPCHGETGKGDGPWTKEWPDKMPRNFRSGVFKFRSTPMGFLPTDDDLKRTIKLGISGTAMPTFKGTLSEAKIEAVIVYLKSFSRRWRDEALHVEAVKIPERPDWMRNGALSQQHREMGKVLFQTHCVSCHGLEGKGDGPGADSLKDFWELPIRPADLSAAHHKSGDKSEDLFRTISLGLDGTPMVGFREVFNEDQIWELVTFVNSLD